MDQLREIARYLDIEAVVECENCNQSFKIDRMLQKKQLPPPYTTVFEIYLDCPNCKFKKFCYYLTEHAKFLQEELQIEVFRWQEVGTEEAYLSYRDKYRKFVKNFELAQRQFGRIMAREFHSGRRKK